MKEKVKNKNLLREVPSQKIGKIRSMVPLLVLAETQLKSRRVLCVFCPFCFLLSSFLPVPGNFTEVLIVISHAPYIQVY